MAEQLDNMTAQQVLGTLESMCKTTLNSIERAALYTAIAVIHTVMDSAGIQPDETL